MIVYVAGGTSALRTISQGVNNPEDLEFDGSGNLFVANVGDNTVTVYAPGKTRVLRTISEGVNGPDALAFDAADNLEA